MARSLLEMVSVVITVHVCNIYICMDDIHSCGKASPTITRGKIFSYDFHAPSPVSYDGTHMKYLGRAFLILNT